MTRPDETCSLPAAPVGLGELAVGADEFAAVLVMNDDGEETVLLGLLNQCQQGHSM